MNQAASTYHANGGDLSGDLSIPEVVARLRSVPNAPGFWYVDSEERLAVILAPVMQSSKEARSGQARAVWNPNRTSFQIATSGEAGTKSFTLIPPPAPEEISVTSAAEPLVSTPEEQRAQREQEQFYAPYIR